MDVEDPDLALTGEVLEGVRLYFFGGVLLVASAASPVLIKARTIAVRRKGLWSGPLTRTTSELLRCPPIGLRRKKTGRPCRVSQLCIVVHARHLLLRDSSTDRDAT